MYLDILENKGKPPSWEEFKDQFLIVLIADGYMNINQNFKENALKKGFFQHKDVDDLFTEID